MWNFFGTWARKGERRPDASMTRSASYFFPFDVFAPTTWFEQKIKTAVVVGGGFIGLEMAENLKEAGVDVTILEAMDQVMAPLDFEMAQMLHSEIRDKGIRIMP